MTEYDSCRSSRVACAVPTRGHDEGVPILAARAYLPVVKSIRVMDSQEIYPVASGEVVLLQHSGICVILVKLPRFYHSASLPAYIPLLLAGLGIVHHIGSEIEEAA